MTNRKITKLVVDAAIARTTDYFMWDSELRGFGLKISKAGRNHMYALDGRKCAC